MSVSNNHVSTKKYRKITLDMVLASTSLTRSSKETADAYLQRVTHLHLQNKKIRVIESLDQCTNLKVIPLKWIDVSTYDLTFRLFIISMLGIVFV